MRQVSWFITSQWLKDGEQILKYHRVAEWDEHLVLLVGSSGKRTARCHIINGRDKSAYCLTFHVRAINIDDVRMLSCSGGFQQPLSCTFSLPCVHSHGMRILNGGVKFEKTYSHLHKAITPSSCLRLPMEKPQTKL
jgi:hypothetical protein